MRRLRFPRLRSHLDGCSHDVTPADPLLLTASWRRPRAAFRNSPPRLSERDSFSLALAPLERASKGDASLAPQHGGIGAKCGRAIDWTV